MIEKLEKVKENALSEIAKCTDEASLNNVKSQYIGKKSVFNEIMSQMKDLSNEEKREVGSVSNDVRNLITQAIDEKLERIKEDVLTELKTALDTGVFQTNTKSCDSCFYSGVCRKKKQKWRINTHTRFKRTRDELTFNASDNDVAPSSPILFPMK